MKKSEFNSLCRHLCSFARTHNLYSATTMNGKDFLTVHFAPNLGSDSDSSLHISDTDIVLNNPLRYSLDEETRTYTTTEELINILKGFCNE